MFYVYILKLINGQYYIGFTRNLRKRLQKHSMGKSNNKTYRPMELVFFLY